MIYSLTRLGMVLVLLNEACGMKNIRLGFGRRRLRGEEVNRMIHHELLLQQDVLVAEIRKALEWDDCSPYFATVKTAIVSITEKFPDGWENAKADEWERHEEDLQCVKRFLFDHVCPIGLHRIYDFIRHGILEPIMTDEFFYRLPVAKSRSMADAGLELPRRGPARTPASPDDEDRGPVVTNKTKKPALDQPQESDFVGEARSLIESQKNRVRKRLKAEFDIAMRSQQPEQVVETLILLLITLGYSRDHISELGRSQFQSLMDDTTLWN